MHIILKELEHVCILYLMVKFDTVLRIIEGWTNLLTLKDQFVEKAGKVHCRLIIDILARFNANNVLHAKIIEHLAKKLRGTGS